jgi:hypothetical protein
MATQITHTALTERVFDQYFYKFDKQNFTIGALFPDIRYMAGINRGITHFENVGFQEILDEKNEFLAGMLYHSYIDKTRQQWLTGNGIYNLIPYDYHWVQALKFYEDRLYYDDVKNWSVIKDFLKKIIPEELKFNIDGGVIKLWHDMLTNYFSFDPKTNTILETSKKIGMPEDVAADINLHIEVIQKNKQITDLCKQFHDDFETILKSTI